MANEAVGVAAKEATRNMLRMQMKTHTHTHIYTHKGTTDSSADPPRHLDVDAVQPGATSIQIVWHCSCAEDDVAPAQ